MLIQITWKLDEHITIIVHIRERTHSPTRMKKNCILCKFKLISQTYICADAWEMFAHANERSEFVRESRKKHRKWSIKITIILFFRKYFSSISWDYFHNNSHTCVTHLTFYNAFACVLKKVYHLPREISPFTLRII
jgi:hypothetical protein